jgi:hypothetical protein
MKIAICITASILAFMLLIRIKSIVSYNMKLTKDIDPIMRRRLLWRYGPFKIDEYVVEQHVYTQNQDYSEPGKHYYNKSELK